jgi:signal transduction histidine kinase
VEAERRVRLDDRTRRLREKAHQVSSNLDQVLRRPLQDAAAEVQRLEATQPTDAIRALEQLVAREELIEGFCVLDVNGRRVFPATHHPTSQPLTERYAPTIGGLAGSTLPHTPARLYAVSLQERGEEALRLLERVCREGGPALRAAALYDRGRIHQGRADRSGVFNALDVYKQLSRMPIDLVDAQGRHTPALGRMRLAKLYRLLHNRRSYVRSLRELVEELEAATGLLPSDLVVELSETAASLLELEGVEGGVTQQARHQANARQELEERYARLQEAFQNDLREALAAMGQTAVASEPRDLLLVKRERGSTPTVLTFAPLRDSRGRLVGLVALELDLDMMERRVRTESTQWLDVEVVSATRALDEAGSDEHPDQWAAPLALPLGHLAIVVSAPADAPSLVEDALNLPRETVTLWALILSVGGIVGGVLVTTRTFLREAKAAQLKSDFVSNVTHELKTPLTSIRMFLETLILGRVADEEEAKECLEVMAREAERLTRLIEQLLVFSRIESRKWRLRLGFEDPRKLVREAIGILADQLRKSPDELGIEVLAVQDLPQIAVDRFAVVEAILNLLHNAWKYSPNKDRKVRVVITSRRRFVEIAIEDNGIGVPRRDRRRIFVKFERASNAELSRIEGSGIGLTLANEIVKAHGGKIQHTKLKPRGSRFSVLVPK